MRDTTKFVIYKFMFDFEIEMILVHQKFSVRLILGTFKSP